jgi:hypothetical protein
VFCRRHRISARKDSQEAPDRSAAALYQRASLKIRPRPVEEHPETLGRGELAQTISQLRLL